MAIHKNFEHDVQSIWMSRSRRVLRPTMLPLQDAAPSVTTVGDVNHYVPPQLTCPPHHVAKIYAFPDGFDTSLHISSPFLHEARHALYKTIVVGARAPALLRTLARESQTVCNDDVARHVRSLTITCECLFLDGTLLGPALRRTNRLQDLILGTRIYFTSDVFCDVKFNLRSFTCGSALDQINYSLYKFIHSQTSLTSVTLAREWFRAHDLVTNPLPTTMLPNVSHIFAHPNDVAKLMHISRPLRDIGMTDIHIEKTMFTALTARSMRDAPPIRRLLGQSRQLSSLIIRGSLKEEIHEVVLYQDEGWGASIYGIDTAEVTVNNLHPVIKEFLLLMASLPALKHLYVGTQESLNYGSAMYQFFSAVSGAPKLDIFHFCSAGKVVCMTWGDVHNKEGKKKEISSHCQLDPAHFYT
ncbi:hypothetical protein B0H10DRAFT_1950160 [Mycena sp. CBHHK59/15]|nr:hypothetical protein B0H10DRAFT_1950160 [Mycena sp. CBHHK59/15]